MLVPVIGLVQVGGQSHADRYTYLPQIGLYLAIVWAIRDWTVSWRWRRQVLGVAAAIVIAALMACSWRQTSYWRNDESLWGHALACTARNYTAHNYLGYALAAQGRTAEAIEHCQKALEINPDYSDANNNLGTVFLNQGRLDEAAEYFHRALEVYPSFAEAHNNLGILLTKQGRTAEAIEHYQKAIELNPNRAEFYNNLGNLLATKGRTAEAIEQFQKALEVEPDNAKVHYNLANILIAQGRWDEAIEHYQQALKQMPDSVHAHYQLGLALQSRGRFAAADRAVSKGSRTGSPTRIRSKQSGLAAGDLSGQLVARWAKGGGTGATGRATFRGQCSGDSGHARGGLCRSRTIFRKRSKRPNGRWI